MRTVRLASLVAVLATLAACGNPIQPSQRHSTPGAPRLDGGIYMGSGLSAGAGSDSTVPDSTASRGSGYIGTGL
jgi:hypothetical protein